MTHMIDASKEKCDIKTLFCFLIRTASTIVVKMNKILGFSKENGEKCDFVKLNLHFLRFMPVQINHHSNLVALRSSNSADSVKKSVSSLASGNKNTTPLADTGSFSQSLNFENEKKRTELSHLNLQSLISYTRLQDEILDQSGKLMNRLNSLAEFALDVTKTDSDREAYDLEFQELLGELESMKKNTFNELNLFINDPVFSEQKKQFIQVLQSQWLTGAEQTVNSRLGIQGSGQNVVTIEVPEDESFPTIWSFDSQPKTLADGRVVEEFKVKLFLDTTFKANFAIASPSDWAERYNVTLMTQLVMADNLYFNALANGDPDKDSTSTGGANWFKEGVSQFVHGGDYLVEFSGGFNQGLVDAIASGDEPSQSTTQSASYYVAVRYLHEKLKDAGHSGGVKDMIIWMSNQVAAGQSPQDSSLGAALVHFLPGYSNSATANDDFISDYKANVLSEPGLNMVFFDADTGAIGGANADGQSTIDHPNAVPDYPEVQPTEDSLAGFQESWENEGEELFVFDASGATQTFESVKFELPESDDGYDIKTQESALRSLEYLKSLLDSVAGEALGGLVPIYKSF